MTPQSPRLRFLGAAGAVTGSKYLLSILNRQILVDCGLFQGLKELRLKNWDRFPIDPKSIDAIVLTHAHIDHSGYIPRLVKEGFRGKIYCTPATLELCRILLPDTGHLQEEEAEYLGRKKLSKHDPVLPLFTEKEATESLKYFVTKDFDEEFEVFPGLSANFRYVGHILGAASCIFRADKIKIAFSGDIGRMQDPIFHAPAKLPDVDYLVVESTYGNRKHEPTDPFADLEKVVNDAVQSQGVIMIPAFAVGRAQSLMYVLSKLRKAKRIPDIPMYLNSPMATSVTKIFCDFKNLHKLDEKECTDMCEDFRYVKSVEESKALNEKKGPMIIVSASGMATGGRILHHLKAFAPDPRNTIVIAGYQAAGTRGRQIQDGAKEVKIHGSFVPIRAKVRVLENLSAHADASEILDWLKSSGVHPKQIFVTHGEPEAALAMKQHIEETLKLNCVVPTQDQEFTLDSL
ncbi:MAG: MBL fold metallo-hydrolase RNA specificity domain-containing protein [Bdellovibrionales bacterium]